MFYFRNFTKFTKKKKDNTYKTIGQPQMVWREGEEENITQLVYICIFIL